MGQADLHLHAAAFGELERIVEQVLEDLTQAMLIGDDDGGTIGRNVNRVVEALPLGHELELS